MPLRWDPPLCRALAAELDVRLGGMRIRALRLDGRARDLVLLLRECTLVWRLHPRRGWPTLEEAAEPARSDLSLPYRVRSVSAPPDERIVRFVLLPARGGRDPLDLTVELLGNQWNALVHGPDGGTIRHLLVTRDGGARPLRVGGGYVAPTPPGRAAEDGQLGREAFDRVLDGLPGERPQRALVRALAWTSPLNASALLALPRPEAWALWRRLAVGDADPVILRGARGPQPYPVPLPDAGSWEGVAGLLEAFARVADEADEAARLHVPPALAERLDGELDRVRRRLTALEAELEALGDPADARALGDLLLARFGDVPRGAERVVLQGFDGAPVEVRLDPSRSPQQNADAWYDEAARRERAGRRLPGLVEAARARVAELEALEARVRAGDVDAPTLEAALPEVAPERSGAEEVPLPYRRYRSSGGLEIRVGRGSRHNDDLTFHHSAPEDVWLHALQSPGAHVVLRWGRQETPPARDLAEAATLAALHSRARTSGRVAVGWTFRKYVRKPRRSPPGRVSPDRVRTVFVEPDPAVEERLRDG